MKLNYTDWKACQKYLKNHGNLDQTEEQKNSCLVLNHRLAYPSDTEAWAVVYRVHTQEPPSPVTKTKMFKSFTILNCAIHCYPGLQAEHIC